MPELKAKQLPDFTPVEYDYSKIPFKDKVREKHRQEKLKIYEQTGVMPGKKTYKPKTPAWSKQKEKKEMKKDKKAKKRTRSEVNISNKDDKDEDYTKEIRLLKKLKTGKITKEQFDIEFDAT